MNLMWKCPIQLGSNFSVDITAVLPDATSDAKGAALSTIQYLFDAKHSVLNGLLRHIQYVYIKLLGAFEDWH